MEPRPIDRPPARRRPLPDERQDPLAPTPQVPKSSAGITALLRPTRVTIDATSKVRGTSGRRSACGRGVAVRLSRGAHARSATTRIRTSRQSPSSSADHRTHQVPNAAASGRQLKQYNGNARDTVPVTRLRLAHRGASRHNGGLGPTHVGRRVPHTESASARGMACVHQPDPEAPPLEASCAPSPPTSIEEPEDRYARLTWPRSSGKLEIAQEAFCEAFH